MIELKNIEGKTLFVSHMAQTVKEAVVEAVGAYTNLSRVDLRGADLKGAYLINAVLYKADLSGANLTDANLSHANLQGANLSCADLIATNLSSTDLHLANLRYANAKKADFAYADMRMADLRDMTFIGADLSFASVANAEVDENILQTETMLVQHLNMKPVASDLSAAMA